MFGMDKKGAGFNYRYDNLGRIKKRMSPESFERFNKFYKNNKRKGINIILHWLKFLWNTKEQYIRYFLNKIGLDVQFNKIGADAISNPGAPSYLFNWGIYELIKKLESENIKESLDENDCKIF